MAHQTADKLDNFIAGLQHTLVLWAEEEQLGDSRGMTKKDLRFLQTRIDRMLKLRQKVADAMDTADAEIDAHRAAW